MTNYVLAYVGGGEPEDGNMDEVMAAWGAWYQKMGDAVVDGGNPFNQAKLVTADGVQDDAPAITGYTIISADSLDEAVEKVKDHPHIKYGGQVSVHQTFQM